MAKRIPRDGRFDGTRALLRDPYGFIAARSRRLGSDVFETRILLRRTLCLSGPAAAALLYDRERFRRRGATPGPVRATLFGKGGVQGLDDEAHRRRKQMLVLLMTPVRMRALAELAIQQWEGAARQWTTSSRVVLYDELQGILARAACAWAGVPLAEAQVRECTRDLASLYDLRIDRARLPALPRDRFVVSNVRLLRPGALARDSSAREQTDRRGPDGSAKVPLAPRV